MLPAQVAEAEKEGVVQKALAQGWQREVALLEPQLHRLQAQLTANEQLVRPSLALQQYNTVAGKLSDERQTFSHAVNLHEIKCHFLQLRKP